MKNDSNKIVNLKKAISKYLDVAKECYYSQNKNESSLKPHEDMVIGLFQKIPDGQKGYCLYFTLKAMFQPTGDMHFTDWNRNLALRFTDKLETI